MESKKSELFISEEDQNEQVDSNGKYKLCYLYSYVLTISLAGFTIGYNFTVYNTLIDILALTLEWDAETTEEMTAYLVSLTPLGAGLISPIGGYVIDKLGRRTAMIYSNLILFVGCVLCLFKVNEIMMIGRLIIGLITGIQSSLIPVYLREISPVDLAGQFGTCYMLFSRVGSLVAYIMGIGLPSIHDNINFAENSYWRIMLGFPLLTIVIQCLLFLAIFKYDTPKYLYFNNRKEDCEIALSMIYTDKQIIERVITKLRALAINESSGRNADISYRDLFGRSHRTAVIVVLLLHLVQEFGGGNIMMLYSASIFKDNHANETTALICTIIVGLIAVDGGYAFSLIVDDLGRKKIMIWGTIGVTLGLVLTGTLDLTGNPTGELIAMMFAFFMYSIACGPATWVLTSELLPAKGVGIASFMNWMTTYGTATLCPILFNSWLGSGGTFYIYAIGSFCAVFYIIFVLKETKGNYDIENKYLYAPKDIRDKMIMSPMQSPSKFRERTQI